MTLLVTHSNQPKNSQTPTHRNTQTTLSAQDQAENRFDLDIRHDEQGNLWVVFNEPDDGTTMVNNGTQ